MPSTSFKGARAVLAHVSAQLLRTGLLLLASLALASPALAQVLRINAPTPTTYSGPGEVITFNFTFSQSNRITTSISLVGMNYPVTGFSCTGLPLAPFGTTTCTGTYTTTAADAFTLTQFGTFDSLDPNGISSGGSITGQAQVVYVEPGTEPSASIAVSPSQVAEDGAAGLVYTVTLSDPAPANLSVPVSYSGTATAGSDYSGNAANVSITSGSTTGSITIDPTADATIEGNETVTVSISAGAGYTLGTPTSATGTILNDDVPITINPATLPNGTVAAAYSQALSATGGAGPYDYNVSVGALPAGLSLSPGGVVSGTPTAGGSFDFTVEVTDSSAFPGPYSDTRAYTLTIDPPTVVLPPTTLPGGTLGQAYSSPINAASGGTAPYAYAVTAGALPGGLSVDPASGAITGTPTAFGTFNFTVTASDSSTGTGPYTAAQNYEITVIDVPPVAGDSSVTVDYNSTSTNVPLNLSGGAPTSLAIGTAPANGTATVTGTTLSYTPDTGYRGADSFTYSATNSGGTSALATVSVTVSDPVISITAGGPLTATVGEAYSQTFTFTGGAQPWTGYTVDNLPAGLAITGNTANTVTISGTPSQAGSFALDVSAADSSTGSGPFSANQGFTLDVAAPNLTLSPPAGTLSAPYGVTYSQDFPASGGIGPYTYVITGDLPAGLDFADATISGTPTAPGSYPITITATDNGSTGTGAPFSVAVNYTIDVPAPTIVLDPASLPDPGAASAYSQLITATGGLAPYTFSIGTGDLPAGLTLSADGQLAGTATEVGSFNFSVTATDDFGQSGSRAYTIAVSAPALTMTPASGPLQAPYAESFSQDFQASGGSGNFSYALTGALPAGMGFSGSTLSGSPTEPGSYPISVTATDTGLTGDGAPFAVTNSFTLVVPAPTIVITPASLEETTAGQPYSVDFSASGGVAPYDFALTAGALPPGLALSAGGELTGTPTASGSFNINVAATDANGQAGDRAYTLVVEVPVLSIDPASLPSGTVGAPYDQSIVASGGIAPYSYAVSAGALPDGLSLSADGELSGTPSAPGSFEFTLTATDSTTGTAATASQAYSVEVVFAPPVANDDAATVLAGESVDIPVTANDDSIAPITSIAIASPPSEGEATVSGLDVRYTAPGIGAPTVTFTYTATGPGGTSAPATVTVTVNPLPIPVAQAVSTGPATPVTVDITAGASGGPFTAAEVVALAPADAGTAEIAEGGSGYLLTFTPERTFAGVATVQFTVSNAFATSSVTTLEVTVEPRPDPSLDPEVLGMIDAQAQSARRFATAQITNFQQRLELLHRGGGGSASNLGFATDRRCLEPLVGQVIDPCASEYGVGGAGYGESSIDPDRGQRTSGAGAQETGRFGTWVGGMIRSGKLDASAGRAGLDFESDGLSAGIDYRVSADLAIGAGFGWGQDEVEIGRNGSRAQGDARTLAAYASWHPGQRFYIDGLVGVQDLGFDLRRYLTGTGGFVGGQRDGDQWFASITAGSDIQRENMLLSPYLRYDIARASLDAYTETGHPVLALAYSPMDVDTRIGTLGVRMDWHREMGWGSFTPQLRLEYQRDFSGRTTAELGYADLPGGPVYGVAASRFDRNRFVGGLGAMFDLSSGWSWRMEYRGQLGSGDQQDHGLQLNVQKQF